MNVRSLIDIKADGIHKGSLYCVEEEDTHSFVINTPRGGRLRFLKENFEKVVSSPISFGAPNFTPQSDQPKTIQIPAGVKKVIFIFEDEA